MLSEKFIIIFFHENNSLRLATEIQLSALKLVYFVFLKSKKTLKSAF